MHLFDKGWNNVRDQIFANQRRLGVIPPDSKLTPWPTDMIKEWSQLTPSWLSLAQLDSQATRSK
jgi:hypothetical protein